MLWGRGSRSNAHTPDALEPGGINFRFIIDEVRAGSGALNHLLEAPGIRTVVRSQDDHDVRLLGQNLGRGLAVLRGVANVVASGRSQVGKTPLQDVYNLVGVIHSEGRLGGHSDPLWIPYLDPFRLVHASHHLDVIRSLARGALYLFVSLVTHQDNGTTLPRKTDGFQMHLGHQGTGRVDNLQMLCRGFLSHFRRGPMRTEDGYRACRNVVNLLDKDHAPGPEGLDHVAIVHNLLANVDGAFENGQGYFHDFDGSVHAGTEAAWLWQTNI